VVVVKPAVLVAYTSCIEDFDTTLQQNFYHAYPIHKLHKFLRPFLLLRLKVDVERALPPKKEYVLYTLLSAR